MTRAPIHTASDVSDLAIHLAERVVSTYDKGRGYRAASSDGLLFVTGPELAECFRIADIAEGAIRATRGDFQEAP